MLGQLLGDFAHSISNPLAVIQGRLELATEGKRRRTKACMMLWRSGPSNQQSLQRLGLFHPSGVSIKAVSQEMAQSIFDVAHRQSPRIMLDVPPLLQVHTDENYFAICLRTSCIGVKPL